MCVIISATVNASGSACPYALKVVACQLLYEITTFLRETYQYIPKSRSTAKKDGGCWVDKHLVSSSTRRWSSVLSSPGHSERSNSRSSQGDVTTHLAGIKCIVCIMHVLAMSASSSV